MEGWSSLILSRFKCEKSLKNPKIPNQNARKKKKGLAVFLTPKCKHPKLIEGEIEKSYFSPIITKNRCLEDEFSTSPLKIDFYNDSQNSFFSKSTKNSTSCVVGKQEKCISVINLPKKSKNKLKKSKTLKLASKVSSPDISESFTKLLKTNPKIRKSSPFNSSQKDIKKLQKSQSPLYQSTSQKQHFRKLKYDDQEKIIRQDEETLNEVYEKIQENTNDHKTLFYSQKDEVTLGKRKNVTIAENIEILSKKNESIFDSSSLMKHNSLGSIKKSCIKKKTCDASPKSTYEEENNPWINIEDIKNDGKTSDFVKNFISKMQNSSVVLKTNFHIK
ncbi:hypothetical protein SteCoe_19606 [Stentor coeruleus]|uniref:Uncharacterized protein n=1 Tax=Stentor coeruleus TaxID=5963 RepID=A0A1R2BTW8_9CILI|nr:hypothetical protein SteCoe_19606 [Stentor coeruleus]